MNREDCGSPITLVCFQPSPTAFCRKLPHRNLSLLIQIPHLLDNAVSPLLSVVTILTGWRTFWWLIDRLARTMVCVHGLLQLNAVLLTSVVALIATGVCWWLVVLLLRIGGLIVIVTLVASVLGWRVAWGKPASAGKGLTASLSAATRVQARTAQEDEEDHDDDGSEQNPAAIGIPGRVRAVAGVIVRVAGGAAGSAEHQSRPLRWEAKAEKRRGRCKHGLCKMTHLL